jgi:hypothetical protein
LGRSRHQDFKAERPFSMLSRYAGHPVGASSILIVEDDPVMLCMVGDYLEQHNMRAVSAAGWQDLGTAVRGRHAL